MLMGRICGSFIHVKVLVNGEVLCLGLLTICDTQSMLSFGFLVLLIFFIWVHCSCLQTHTSRVCIRSHYRWLWSTMWFLGIELRTYVRAVSALNLWAISPAPWFSYIPWTSWFHLSTLRYYLVPLHGWLTSCFSSASKTNDEQAEEMLSLPQCNGGGESSFVSLLERKTPPLFPSDPVLYILRRSHRGRTKDQNNGEWDV